MILIDNTVLSNFALVGELILLKDYCQGKGAATEYVLAEFERGIKEGIFVSIKLDWLKKSALADVKEKSFFGTLCKRLGAGEASCLAIAIYRGYDLLSDDMAIRKIANNETRRSKIALRGKYKSGIAAIPNKLGRNLKEKALTPNESIDSLVRIQKGRSSIST
jgi:predicted nucleic acid-binding protein